MPLRSNLLASAAFATAAALAVVGASWAATMIEDRSAEAVRSRLTTAGLTFVDVRADGLQVWLTGTAPNEAARFRAVNAAGSVVDAARLRDALEVIPVREIEAPRFSVEMLRNDDGVSLIGLLPETAGTEDLAEAARGLATGLQVADMLETADFPAPEGWSAAVDFGLKALRLLPQSKISVAADRVSITAISDSEQEKRRLEGQILRLAPEGLELVMNISAPRPVLTPFTLRFVMDEEGARFDACSADTARARDRILAAGRAAGVAGETTCTIGLGVPSPRWAEAAEAGLRAVAELGAGSVTFSDADVTLEGRPGTPRAAFDRAVGALEAALPPVFSLEATLPPAPQAVPEGPAEFRATLSEAGRVELAGRVTDELTRKAVDSFARAQFGASKVRSTTRLDGELPEGWPVRVLAGLESLAQLQHGELLVRADTVEVNGVTGSKQASARISQVLSARLGQGRSFKVDVIYDEKFDPEAALPTPQECMTRIRRVLAGQKITFEPGSAEIDPSARGTLDGLAEVFKDCKGMPLEISGHTDSQGSEGGNKALSQARAEAVLMALQGRRVDVGRMKAVGYGEERPIADNRDEAGREANRRIEFTLLGDDGNPVDEETPVVEETAEASEGPSAAPAEMTLRPKRRPQDG
ncbi:OmpA family protein [Cereibacter azotoformans]|uniref:OOP family OmpA-OmpF porin n=1 Tax=Cereibacter azotoformans TaxID=43057 RepID=A0A2T5KEF1_9RHOB|nr:OmpA family protein [Cereibacter azotoformans]AXQ92494.1 BON domain-containing protein [Cereibacter sphaeroides]MBO4169930.1 OmpA family protein [Cereibacter azotoformans]PTR20808.1 OOP family OmpA-OmpF porin [Cereibacter azotoformans]UIJ30770.1 OmpA family protein [Cereibacter azotoformans]